MLTLKVHDEIVYQNNNIVFDPTNYDSISFTYNTVMDYFVLRIFDSNNNNYDQYTFSSPDYDNDNVTGLAYGDNPPPPDIELRNTIIYDSVDFDFVDDGDLVLYMVLDTPTPPPEQTLIWDIEDSTGTSIYNGSVTGTTLTRITSSYNNVLDIYDIRFYYLTGGNETYVQQIVPADGSDVPYDTDFGGYQLDHSGLSDFTTSCIFGDTTTDAIITFIKNPPITYPTFPCEVEVLDSDGNVNNVKTIDMSSMYKFNISTNITYQYYDVVITYYNEYGNLAVDHIYATADGMLIPFIGDVNKYSVNNSGEYVFNQDYINTDLKGLVIRFIIPDPKDTPKELLKKCCKRRLKDFTIDNPLYDKNVNDFFKILSTLYGTVPAWLSHWEYVSNEYFMNHSGLKFISPMFERLMRDVVFKSAYTEQMTNLVQAFLIKYGQDINNYFEIYKVKYGIDDPDQMERTRTPNLTENNDTSEARNFTDSQTGTPVDQYYGFNSATATDVSQTVLDSTVEHVQDAEDNVKEHEKRLTGTDKVEESRHNYHGDLFNKGITALQFFKLYNFYDYLFRLIDKTLTIDLYF